jgi:hypothetical protein
VIFVSPKITAQTVTGDMSIAVRVVILPVAPSGLEASAASATRIDLAWTDNASNELGFKIEEKVGSGTYSEIDSVGSNITSYAVTALSGSTTYYFRIRAFNNDGTSAYTSEVYATTSAAPQSSSNPTSGGGGGGGPSPYIPSPTASTLSVNISGIAYPSSKINVLLDNALASTVTASKDASFSFSIDTTVGVHNFGIYTTDANGRRSSIFTFTLSLNSGTVASVSGIFLAPIIDIDKSEIKKGDTLSITGQTAPSSTVTIYIHSEDEIEKDVVSNGTGKYSYALDTNLLELGDHTVKSTASFSENLVSPDSQLISFKVGRKTVGKYVEGDTTKDGKVNMVDFSVLLYHWNKGTNEDLAASDFNHDGKVNMVDLSVMLYHWTD